MWYPSPDSNWEPPRLERGASAYWARGVWWTTRDSNPDLPSCKDGVLPLRPVAHGANGGVRTHCLCLTKAAHIRMCFDGLTQSPSTLIGRTLSPRFRPLRYRTSRSPVSGHTRHRARYHHPDRTGMVVNGPLGASLELPQGLEPCPPHYRCGSCRLDDRSLVVGTGLEPVIFRVWA